MKVTRGTIEGVVKEVEFVLPRQMIAGLAMNVTVETDSGSEAVLADIPAAMVGPNSKVVIEYRIETRDG